MHVRRQLDKIRDDRRYARCITDRLSQVGARLQLQDPQSRPAERRPLQLARPAALGRQSLERHIFKERARAKECRLNSDRVQDYCVAKATRR